MKKLLLIIFSSLLLFANGVLNVNISDEFSSGENWEIKMSNNGTYYIMLPMDVSLDKLQNALPNDNSYMYVYRWYQKKDIFAADFGVKSLVLIKITKDSITYYVYNPDKSKYENAGTTFEEVKNYLETNIAPKISDESKKNIFLNSYVKSLDKINKNKLYLVKPKGFDFDISIALNLESNTQSSSESSSESSSQASSASSSSSSQASSESSSESDEVESPPSVPVLSSNSDSETLETPPNPPKVEEEREE